MSQNKDKNEADDNDEKVAHQPLVVVNQPELDNPK